MHPRSRRHRYCAVLLVPLGVAACEWINNADDLSGGPSVEDAGGDGGSATDAGEGGFAPGDAGAEADAPATVAFSSGPLIWPDPAPIGPPIGRWCKGLTPTPFFCADFDDPTGVLLTSQGWDTVVDDTDAGYIALVDAGALTPPNAAYVSATVAANVGNQHVAVRRSLALSPAASEVCLSFDVKLDSVSAYAEIASIQLFNGANFLTKFNLALTPLQIAYFQPDGGQYYGVHLDAGTPVTVATWTRFRIHARFNPDGGSPEVEVTFPGQAPTGVIIPIAPLATVDRLEIDVGAANVAGGATTTTFQATFDDVALTLPAAP